MVEETIRTIKETENEADEIVRKADATCTEILEKAAKEAEAIKEETVTKAKNLAEADLLKTKEEGETKKAEALRMMKQDTEALKALAKTQEEEAIAVVMKSLLS